MRDVSETLAVAAAIDEAMKAAAREKQAHVEQVILRVGVNTDRLQEELAEAFPDLVDVSTGKGRVRLLWKVEPTVEAWEQAAAIVAAHDPHELSASQQMAALLDALEPAAAAVDLAKPLSAEDTALLARVHEMRARLGRH